MKPTAYFGRNSGCFTVAMLCWFCAAFLAGVTAGPVESMSGNSTDRSFSTTEKTQVSNQGSPSVSCHEVRQIFAMKQIGSAQLVPSSQINGESNELCPSTLSCCNPKMEEKYSEAVKKDLASMIQTASSYLKTLVATSATKFRKTFADLLRNSENQTLAMIADGYKTMEPSAKGLVTEFYSNLTSYITGGLELDVEERVAEFFDSLFPLVYHHVINPKLKDVGEDFKECLRETRDEIRPFGEVPQDLATNLDRSLSLAKVFLQALSLGVEVINTTEHMDFGSECGKALVKLTYCPHCRGVVQAKPCGPYCLNVIRGCLAQVAELDRPWADFINALERMSSGFVRTYSLEEVTSRVHDEVNAAIMSASEMGPDLSKKVKLACGHPRREARDVTSALKSSVVHKSDEKTSNDTSTTSETQEGSSAIQSSKVKNARAAGEEPLIQRLQSFARKLSESKSFFATLADKLCSVDHLSTRSDQCWNGHEFAEYYKTIAGVGISAMKYNPEFRSAKNSSGATLIPAVSSPVPTLVDKLMHLKQVLNDKALSVPQSDSYNVEGSGSGSYHNRLDDTDDEDLVDGSGSGDDEDNGEPHPKPDKGQDDLGFDDKINHKSATGKKPSGNTAPSIRDSSFILLAVAAFTSLSLYHNQKSRILLQLW